MKLRKTKNKITWVKGSRDFSVEFDLKTNHIYILENKVIKISLFICEWFNLEDDFTKMKFIQDCYSLKYLHYFYNDTYLAHWERNCQLLVDVINEITKDYEDLCVNKHRLKNDYFKILLRKGE